VKENFILRIKISTLVIVGLLATAISFVYYFVLKSPFVSILYIIYIIDFLLFTLSAYRTIEAFELSKIKTTIFTVILIIFFFLFSVALVFLFTAGTKIDHTFELLFNVLRVTMFLSPSFIALLPIICFIAEVLS
jgi:hypothetical protein